MSVGGVLQLIVDIKTKGGEGNITADAYFRILKIMLMQSFRVFLSSTFEVFRGTISGLAFTQGSLRFKVALFLIFFLATSNVTFSR